MRTTLPQVSEDLSVYSRPAIFFHWTIAIFIGLAYLAIEVRGPKGSDSRAFWTNIHFLSGLLVFSLSSLRVLWRLWHGAPPDTHDFPAFLARLAHLILYIFIFMQPILGILLVNTGGGGVRVPLVDWNIALVGADPIAHHLVRAIHIWLGNAFYWVIGLHAAAALGHHFLLKDETHQADAGMEKAALILMHFF